MELDHGVLAQIVNDLVEVSVFVVDDSPPTAPSWHTVDLTESTSAQNWHILGQIAHRDEWTGLIVAQSVINLIRDNRNLVLISNRQNLEHVLLGEARPTWV